VSAHTSQLVTEEQATRARLSMVDRFLPVWILAAMALGLALGRLIPGLAEALDTVKIGSVSLPIAIGLLVMMYPVLAKVRYNETHRVLADRRLLVTSLVINWVLAPAFMFILAWVFLADLPEYRTGLIIVGLARCIAMVLIWNDPACGDREAAAVLVAIKSVFQVVAFGALGWFYLQVLPSGSACPPPRRSSRCGPSPPARWSSSASPWWPSSSPPAPSASGGSAARLRRPGAAQDRALALYGLLFTIVILFALQDTIIAEPGHVARIALPLLVYFAVVFTASLLIGRALKLG